MLIDLCELSHNKKDCSAPVGKLSGRGLKEFNRYDSKGGWLSWYNSAEQYVINSFVPLQSHSNM